MPKICHIEITPIDRMPRVWREAQAAKDAGWETVVIGEGVDTVRNGIQYIGFPKPKSRLNRMLVRSKKMVETAAQLKADIIQLHSPELLLFVHKLKGCRIIFDSHEYYVEQIKIKPYIPAFLRGSASRIYEQFEKIIFRKINAVLYPSSIQGKLPYSSQYAPHCQIVANFSDRRLAEDNDCYDKEDAVIYAGALSYNRGISYLAEAAFKANVKLYLCGNFESAEFKNEITNGPYSGCIVYFGIVDQDRLFELYKKCKIGASTLLPVGQYSEGDTMATKIYEYLQCGLPVICSNFPYNVAQNDKYHFGLCVDPTQVADIAAGIRYLIEHPEEAYEMGENGRRAVKEEFNWDVEKKKLLDLYELILKEG